MQASGDQVKITIAEVPMQTPGVPPPPRKGKEVTALIRNDLTIVEATEDQLKGLTSAQVENARNQVDENGEKIGMNEVYVKIDSELEIFLRQFVGVMPACIIVCVILSLGADDWIDVIIISFLLFCNAFIGYHEESEAQKALMELKAKSVCKPTPTRRDGSIQPLIFQELVPGDVVVLVGGMKIPADCRWLSGDVVSVDTAALTGEPVPRKIPSVKTNKETDTSAVDYFLGAECFIVNGECKAVVEKTGKRTLSGSGSASVAASKKEEGKSKFEEQILKCVSVIIIISFAVALVLFLVQWLVRNQGYQAGLKIAVALLVGSVPIALPLVLVVTMALGKRAMSEKNALVTNPNALANLANMTCLNSDKTGTLTTAHMEISIEKISVQAGFTIEQCLEYAVAACNRADTSGHIDGAIFRAYESLGHVITDPNTKAPSTDYSQLDAKWDVGTGRFWGFNNAAKRVCVTVKPKNGDPEFMITKGLVQKILRNKPLDASEPDTEEGTHPQWICKDYALIGMDVNKEDVAFSMQGYKTLAIGVQRDLKGNGPVEFVGILPMLDPPRHDTLITIQKVREAGVAVKMITGDHVNIAKTTAQLISLGPNIYSNLQMYKTNEDKSPMYEQDEHTDAMGIVTFTDRLDNMKQKIKALDEVLVINADGFGSVMPSDKLAVVNLEKRKGWICGMTGDGANDAPALASADVGIAVHGATEAAKGAAGINLLSPGLGAIYDAIIESRKIFRRLKAYVTFRIAATIQIVTVLAVITLASGCMLDTIYIVILAIMNDLSMMPLSKDVQKASAIPEKPTVWSLLLRSTIYGFIQASLSLAFFYIATSDTFPLLHTMPISYNQNPIYWRTYIYDGAGKGPLANAYNGCMNTSSNAASAMLPCASSVGLVAPGVPHHGNVATTCTEITTLALFLQIFVSSEISIFSMRQLGPWFMSWASPWLYLSVLTTCFFWTILVAEGVPRHIPGLDEPFFSQALGWKNAVYVWAWCIFGFIFLDHAKEFVNMSLDGSVAEITEDDHAEHLDDLDRLADVNPDDSNFTAYLERCVSSITDQLRSTSPAVVLRQSVAEKFEQQQDVSQPMQISKRKVSKAVLKSVRSKATLQNHVPRDDHQTAGIQAAAEDAEKLASKKHT